jgi:hypothetical protein
MQQLAAMLDQWTGARVAVRMVTTTDDLLAVFRGRLGPRSPAKQPALFWLLDGDESDRHPEQPGLYLHAELFEGASVHPGDFVVEFCQGGVTVNMRRLEGQ